MNSKAAKKQEKKTLAIKAHNTPNPPIEKKAIVSAQERCRAVLLIWTERRTPTQICREFGVAWAVVNNWQKRALVGMCTGLEPRGRKDRKHKSPLPSKLRSLLENHRMKTEKRTISTPMEKNPQKFGDTA